MPRVPISEFECPICHTRVKTETGVYRIFTNCTNCGYGMVDRFTPDNTKELQRFAQYHKVGRVTGRWLPKKWYLSNGDEIIPAVGKGGKLVWLRREKWTSGRYKGRRSKGDVPFDSFASATRTTHDEVVTILRTMRNARKRKNALTLLRDASSNSQGSPKLA